jgi:Na+-driven multidrug efflux pump
MFALFTAFGAFASAIQILLGRNDERRAAAEHRAAFRSGLLVLTAGGLIIGAVLLAFPTVPVTLMTEYGDVRTAAGEMVRLVAVALPVMGLCQVLAARFRAAGATNRDLQTNTIAVWAVQVPLTALLVFLGAGVVSLYFGYLAYWLARLLALLVARGIDDRRAVTA